MKTALYKYTHKTDVDSSLADVVYYNDSNYTMAIQFKSNGYSTPSVFYGNVPQAFYEGFVKSQSLGKSYNMFVKDKLPNLSEGTVYGVTYEDENPEPIEDQKDAQSDDSVYLVHGYVRISGSFVASDRNEAREKFLDSLTEDGYDEDEIAVTEVEIVG